MNGTKTGLLGLALLTGACQQPRLRSKRHLDASPAFGNEPRALCWETHRGNLGFRGARDKFRLVPSIRQTTCKWCLRVLRDHAQLQSFYVERAPTDEDREAERKVMSSTESVTPP